eukprot:scaffold10621_cov39-Phaeocystis_antarctica.AAC.1
MSCHSGGLESSPLSRLPVLHRSSVRGLVGRYCAREAAWAERCASSLTQHAVSAGKALAGGTR